MKLDTILIKVASRCNINCTYCYVYNLGDTSWKEMPAQVSLETIQAIADFLYAHSITEKHPFATVLHGGEPLLLGAVKLRLVLKELREKLPESYPIGIQTNGILITEEILDLCSEMNTSISVSVDGPKEVHDRDRLGHDGAGTFDKVIQGVALLRAHPDRDFLYTGILSVVNPITDPKEIYSFLKSLDPPSLDFLYRDGNHTTLPIGKASFSSTEYGSWFVRLLDVYLADPRPIRIRFLDDLIKLTLGGLGTKDGTGVTDYGVLVIDTDGTITKNDTLKSSFDGADRFHQNWSAMKDDLAKIIASDEFADYHALQKPSSLVCKTCPDLNICGGGMTLHRWKNGTSFNNPSVYCSDQKLLIRRIREQLGEAERGL
ncbi:MAG: cyclophane-forming radical SAM/SPASM peptide maturase YhhB [Pyrinomonadaceae bacterium]